MFSQNTHVLGPQMYLVDRQLFCAVVPVSYFKVLLETMILIKDAQEGALLVMVRKMGLKIINEEEMIATDA